MTDYLPNFRLRTLFGITTLTVFACALAAMLDKMSPTQFGGALCLLGLGLGPVVGYRRAGTPIDRSLAAGLFMLGAIPLSAFFALVASVWQAWNSATPNMLEVGAGGFLTCLLAPAAAVIAVLMVRAWTWSAYDANPLIQRDHAGLNFEG